MIRSSYFSVSSKALRALSIEFFNTLGERFAYILSPEVIVEEQRFILKFDCLACDYHCSHTNIKRSTAFKSRVIYQRLATQVLTLEGQVGQLQAQLVKSSPLRFVNFPAALEHHCQRGMANTYRGDFVEAEANFLENVLLQLLVPPFVPHEVILRELVNA